MTTTSGSQPANFWGLTPIDPAPEPSSLVLLGSGAVATVAAARRRKARR